MNGTFRTIGAALLVSLACTACGEKWEVAFDPSSFLAEELGAEARRAMAEVASLARAYGWSEREILAMSAARRQGYLELAR